MSTQPGDREKGYDFFAFISYKSRDQAWANWLQKNLERFRLPNKLSRQGEYPRRLSPVFVYTADLLAGGAVNDLLSEKLGASKYLIVICSKNMQNEPKYIDYEIGEFLRRDHSVRQIIPFIVDGEAVSDDPALECYPPTLLNMGDARPLGINAVTEKRRVALYKLVATMLELNLDAFVNRETARRQKRIVTLLGSGLALALSVAGFALRQTLLTTRAQMSERLTFADYQARQDDLTAAQSLAMQVLDQAGPTLGDDIAERARELAFFASIHPDYAPYCRLTDVTGGSEAFLTTDGQRVVVKSDARVNVYDLTGAPLLSFEAAGRGHHIAAASPDGEYAVVETSYSAQSPETALWLWRMSDQTKLRKLIASNHFYQADIASGDFSDVVSAKFSPDGSLLCAYRTGGYFNASDELAILDAKTGEQVYTLSSALLGPESVGGKNREIVDFAFLSDTEFYWKGNGAHVFGALDGREPLVVSFADAADAMTLTDKCRYAFEGDSTIADIAAGKRLTLPLRADEWFGAYRMLDERYAVFFGFQTVGREWTALSSVHVIDLKAMARMDVSDAFAPWLGAYTALDILSVQGAPRLYLTLGSRYTSVLGGRIDESSTAVLRLDIEAGTLTTISEKGALRLPGASCTAFACGETDHVLARQADGSTLARRITGGAIVTFDTNIAYQELVDSACFGTGGAMLMRRQGGYYLCSLVPPGQCLGQAENGAFDRVALSDGAEVVAASDGGKLVVWRGGARVQEDAFAYPLRGVALSGDGTRLAAADANTLRVYGAAGQTLHTLDAGAADTFLALKMSGDGTRLLVLDNAATDADTGRLTLYDTASMTPIGTLSEQINLRESRAEEEVFALSPDGRLAAAIVKEWLDGSFETTVQVYRLSDGARVASTDYRARIGTDGALLGEALNQESKALSYRYVCFLSGDKLAAGFGSDLWIWDAATGAQTAWIQESEGKTDMPSLLQDGTLLFYGKDIRLWNLLDGTITQSLADQGAHNSHLLSPDGAYCALSGAAGAVLYRTSDWRALCTLSGADAQVCYVSGEKIVYTAEGGLYIIRGEDDPL